MTFICDFCDTPYEKERSLRIHRWQCSKNPDRVIAAKPCPEDCDCGKHDSEVYRLSAIRRFEDHPDLRSRIGESIAKIHREDPGIFARARNQFIEMVNAPRSQEWIDHQADALRMKWQDDPEWAANQLKRMRHHKDTAIELQIRDWLKDLGYKIELRVIDGFHPDVYLPELGAVVEADGCLWHECPEHGKGWYPERPIYDAERDDVLASAGIKSVRIWEHEIWSENGSQILEDRLLTL